MIMDVLGNLSPEVEVVESRDVKRKEKRLSSMPKTVLVRMLGSKLSSCQKSLLTSEPKNQLRSS